MRCYSNPSIATQPCNPEILSKRAQHPSKKRPPLKTTRSIDYEWLLDGSVEARDDEAKQTQKNTVFPGQAALSFLQQKQNYTPDPY